MPHTINTNTPVSLPLMQSFRDSLRRWANDTYGPQGWSTVAIVATGPGGESDVIEVANPAANQD